jgi:dockerin type I repeat protein
MTSKRISTFALGWAALSTVAGFTADEPPLPSIAFKFLPLSEGITVIEDDRATIWQFAAPSGVETRFCLKMAVILSVRFELCEVEPEACGGAEGPGHCFDAVDDDGDGRVDGLDPDCYGIQGWSLPVRAEHGWLDRKSLTTRGTVADLDTRPPGRRDSDSNFEKTEFADPVNNSGYWGLISAIALTLSGDVRLFGGEHSVLLFEGDLIVPPGTVRRERLAGFQVLPPEHSGLRGGSGQPVQTVVTANGDSQRVEVPRPVEIEAVVINSLSSGDRFIRGDANTDGRVDIADAVALLNVLFRSGTSLRCLDAADTNGDGEVGVTDAVLVVRHQFLGGTPPSAPYPDCGRGVPDGLGCEDGPGACEGGAE